MTLGETETLVAASSFGGVLAFTAVLTGLGMLVQAPGASAKRDAPARATRRRHRSSWGGCRAGR